MPLPVDCSCGGCRSCCCAWCQPASAVEFRWVVHLTLLCNLPHCRSWLPIYVITWLPCYSCCALRLPIVIVIVYLPDYIVFIVAFLIAQLPAVIGYPLNCRYTDCTRIPVTCSEFYVVPSWFCRSYLVGVQEGRCWCNYITHSVHALWYYLLPCITVIIVTVTYGAIVEWLLRICHWRCIAGVWRFDCASRDYYTLCRDATYYLGMPLITRFITLLWVDYGTVDIVVLIAIWLYYIDTRWLLIQDGPLIDELMPITYIYCDCWWHYLRYLLIDAITLLFCIVPFILVPCYYDHWIVHWGDCNCGRYCSVIVVDYTLCAVIHDDVMQFYWLWLLFMPLIVLMSYCWSIALILAIVLMMYCYCSDATPRTSLLVLYCDYLICCSGNVVPCYCIYLPYSAIPIYSSYYPIYYVYCLVGRC